MDVIRLLLFVKGAVLVINVGVHVIDPHADMKL